MEKKLLNQKEFAKFIGVSENTVRAWISKGMPSMKISTYIIRIDVDQAMKWLEEQSSKKEK
jgi:DNA-binding transcriptional regulator YiaG